MSFASEIAAFRERAERFDIALQDELKSFVDKVAGRETVEQKIADLEALGYTVTAPAAPAAPAA